MRTTLRSETAEVAIGDGAPFVIIGEKINPTGRKTLATALQERNFDFVRDLAIAQVGTGAQVLDINAGVPGEDESVLLPEVVAAVAAVVEVPLCIDSGDREALAAALAVAPGKVLVNSVNGEEASLERILPVVKEHGAAVVGLTLDDKGIPDSAEGRLDIARRIVERAEREGIAREDVVIDPLVLTVGADPKAAAVTLDTIELVRNELGVNVNLGASNVSFGLPDRPTVNQAFLALGIRAGATCAITDAAKLGAAIRATELLLGRDERGRGYMAHWRAFGKGIAP